MAITDNLTQKLGPLPVWVWGLGGAAVIIVGRQILSARGSSDQVPADLAGSETIGGAGPSGVPSAAVPSNPAGWGGPAADAPGGTDVSTLPPQTNEEWRTRAIQQLPRSYGFSAAVVGVALDKYLSGQALSPTDENIVRAAQKELNYPPAGAPDIRRESPNPQTSETVQGPQGPVAGTPGQQLTFYRLRIYQGPGRGLIYSNDSITKSSAEQVIQTMVTDNNNAPGVQSQNSYYGQDQNPFWRRYELTPA